jgi:hypothetical protein
MFSAITRMRPDWARMPDAAIIMEVEKSILASPYYGWPMAVRIIVSALE